MRLFTSRRFIKTLLLLFDAISTWAIFLVASYTRFDGEKLDHWRYIGLDPYMIGIFLVFSWVICLWIYKTYDISRLWSVGQELWAVGAAGLTLAVALTTSITVFKAENVSRLFLLMFVTGAVVSASILRLIIRYSLTGMRKQHGWRRYVLMVGSNQQGRQFAEKVQMECPGVQVIGWLDNNSEGNIMGAPVLGKVADLPSVLANSVVDSVVVVLSLDEMGLIGRVIEECENQGKYVHILLDGPETRVACSKMEVVLGYPTLAFSNVPNRLATLALKRIIDITVASIGIILFSPCWLVIAILIKFDSAGPILFRQQRVGLNGRLFTMLKFRTMISDAEKHLNKLMEQNEMKGGPVFKIRNDPRITRVGRWLRKTSLDETPQFLNVLKGEMSVVGPRPPLPKEVALYERWQRRRLSVKPGLTCYWQVEGRNDIQFEEWVKLDLKYIDTWSLWTDLRIMLRTIPVILGAKGM